MGGHPGCEVAQVVFRGVVLEPALCSPCLLDVRIQVLLGDPWILVSPRDSHLKKNTLWGGTQDTDFYIGKVGGFIIECYHDVI